MRWAGLKHSRFLLFYYHKDQPSSVPTLFGRFPLESSCTSKEGGMIVGGLGENKEEIAQASSLISSRNNLAPAL